MPRPSAAPHRLVPRRLVPRLALVAVLAALAVVACGSAGASPEGSASASTSPMAAAATAAPSPAPGTSSAVTEAPPTGLDASPPTSPAPSVAIDDSLADLLPASVDGVPVERSAETETAALTSPSLGADADGFAAVQVATADLTDLAIASIVRLKRATDADAFYADWRPGFDEAVCAPAGGVSSAEVRTIAGRTVDTTLCLEGARVYHVRLDGGRILVSVLDVGTKGFGQGLLEGLED
jgi:hypothetical protein